MARTQGIDVVTRELRQEIGPLGFFTLSFGSIVGSGWVVILGDWLEKAAPGGALLGLLIGSGVMMLIGLCYAELATRLPGLGGEFLYTLKSFGPFPAFIVAWFISLTAVAVGSFEGIALAWLLTTLIPQLALGMVKTPFGQSIQIETLIIGIGGAIAVAALHCSGTKSAIRFQNVVTVTFFTVISAVIVTGIGVGDPRNILPLFEVPGGGSWLAGMAWIFASAAFFLNGFQTAVHGLEERRTDVKTRSAVIAMLAGIVAAVVFYCALIIATSFAAPWRSLIGAELPAAEAFSHLPFGRYFSAVILTTAAVSLTKTWTAIALMGSRLILAQARLGFLPAVLAHVSPRTGAPTGAIIFLTVFSIIGVQLGRPAVVTIVNMCAICMAISFVVCVACLLRQRQCIPALTSYRVPGGTTTIWIALVGAIVMAAVAIFAPLFRTKRGYPLEWVLILGWLVLGMLAWSHTRWRAVQRKAAD
jgi:basic amino acid/polyamine antiporter, APA family